MLKNRIVFLSFLAITGFSNSSFAYHDAFPLSEAPFVSGPASLGLNWIGENFESYANGYSIECSSNQSMANHIDVTSGCLLSRSAGVWKRGWTEDSVFRVLAVGRDAYGRKIKWTDQTNEFRAYISTWHNNGDIPAWSGIHAFARYRTSDDLYVASIRYDGLVEIKRKWNGIYTTLAQTNLDSTYLDSSGLLLTGRWYKVKFSAIGSNLKLYLDDKLLLNIVNSTFSWGTVGIRLDNASIYLDDWKLVY